MMGTLALLLLGCANGDVASPCDSAPPVTWASFAEGFLITHCQGCHASTSPNRYGAPEAVAFDTLDQSRVLSESIRGSVMERETMPPAGGVSDDELALLEIWLSCGL